MDKKRTISVKIAGAAGQGVESGGQGLAKALRRGGLHVFGVSDYMSLIKGGHNFFQITLSNEPVFAHTEKFHIVVSFDPQNVSENSEHASELHENGLFICDQSAKIHEEIENSINKSRAKILRVPITKIATEIGGNRIMANTAALGTVAGLLKLPFEKLESVIKDNFGSKKGAEIAEKNTNVAKAGYEYALENAKSFPYQVEYLEHSPERMLINGNEAIAFGAYLSGCRFISAYPMTPGTSVMEWFAKRNRELGVVVKHVEDEIASICMAIGAAQVGARAMTTTSGGGFCLMVEALGLAGMTEVGVVVVNAMRGGPSTGLPTRTEQADLLFAINASHGEFPKAVLTPGTIEECFEVGIRAHNLAEKYQIPVIILTDQLLAAEIRDTDPAFFKRPVGIDRGKLLSKEDLDKLEDGTYLRYKFTEDGISPRALQGHPKAVFAPSTDEHDETGHITENADNRIKMMDKRMQKLERLRKEIKGPEFYGPEEADLTLVVWGSTYGAARDALDLYNRNPENKSSKINLLHFSELWPFPVEKTKEAFSKIKLSISVEQNYTSQLCQLILSQTGINIKNKYNRYDGRPISPEEICREVKKTLGSLVLG